MHQFCFIGEHAFSAMGTVILKDVPPYVTVAGNPANAHGLNTEGLKRHGFEAETILALRRAYKTIYKQRLTVEQALAALEEPAAASAPVARLAAFVRTSSRGIVR